MPGEIATAYVRLRPISDNFKSEAQSQITASLAQLNRTAAAQSATALRDQVDLAKRSDAELAGLAHKQARVNVESSLQQIRANDAIGKSYRRLAADDQLSTRERQIAARLATEAEQRSFANISRGSREAEGHVHALSDSVKGLVATFGTTIGAVAGINFIKEVVSSAAQGQKAAETITAQFGKAGQAIKRFAEGSAANLGVSAATAETTAAKFGIAYRQIGLTGSAAAKMTLGFEKLAGSIATIRGANPALIFQNLSLAAFGNTRSLRQLGISVDATQIKFAALKLGIISSITQALTPAQKAQATYAIATARLATYQAQASKHSGDLANQQRKLSAEWSNAKDILGTALLPDISKVITKLATWLGNMEKTGRLQRDANKAVRDFDAILRALKGAFDLIAPPVEKAIRLVGGLKNALYILGGTIAAFKVGELVAGLTGIETQAAASTKGITRLKNALIGLRTLGIIGVTIAVAFEVAKGGESLSNFLGKTGLGKALGLGNTPGGDIAKALQFAIQTRDLKTLRTFASHDFFSPAIRAAAQAQITAIQAAQTGPLGKKLKDVIAGFWGTAGLTGKAAEAAAKGIAVGAGKIQDAMLLARARIENNAATAATIDKLKKKFSLGEAVANSIFNQGVARSIKNAQDRLSAAIKTGNQQIAAAIAQGKQLVGNATTSLQNYILRGTLALMSGVTSDQSRLATVGKQAIKNLTTLGSTLISDLNKFQTAAATKGPLTGIGPFGAATAQLQALIAGGVPSAQLQRLEKAVQSQLSGRVPKGTQTASQKLGEAKRLVQAHIALLVEQAQKGEITVKSLGDRLNKYLEKSGFTYKRLAHVVGTAAADKIKGDVANITKQLYEINQLPAKLRKQLIAATHGGLNSPVVDIVATQAKINRAERLRSEKYTLGLNTELKKLRTAITKQHDLLVKAEARSKTAVAKAQQHLADVNQTQQLRVAQHHLAEAKKQTTLLTTISHIQAKAQKVNQGLANVIVGPGGFPTSTSKNPGIAAIASRVSAGAGIVGAGG